MSPDGEPVRFYHKIHLVPFTESFPYKDEYPWLADLLDKFDTSNWLEGDERTIFDHPVARFFTPICFEDIFPDDVRRFVLNDADVIVNISNDYWSLTPVEGKQHAVHAMFRAVENRRPMVRATASGLTTYITPAGRMARDFPDYYTAGYLMVDIPIRETGLTIYTRFGDWFAKLCLIGSGAAAVVLLALWLTGIVRRIGSRRRDNG
jgi:apolipoprotein N-acyltransferase